MQAEDRREEDLKVVPGLPEDKRDDLKVVPGLPEDDWPLGDVPPELTAWALLYLDHLVGLDDAGPPEPPVELMEEAQYLAAVLRENYGFAIEPEESPILMHTESEQTSTKLSFPDTYLHAARPAIRSALHVPPPLVSPPCHEKGKRIHKLIVRGTDTFAEWAIERGLSPCVGTVVTTVLASVTAVGILGDGSLPARFSAALAMTLLPGVDVADAALAKHCRNPRRAVLFDQVADRVSDVIILGALAMFGFRHDTSTGWISVVTLAAALISSYLWAETAALRLPTPKSHLGRRQRLLALTAGTWLTLAYPVGGIRIAVIVAAVCTVTALLERVFYVARLTMGSQPEWLGARAEAWAEGEFTTRLVEHLQGEDSRIVIVHTTGPYNPSKASNDVVAVVESDGDHTRVEYFRPPSMNLRDSAEAG